MNWYTRAMKRVLMTLALVVVANAAYAGATTSQNDPVATQLIALNDKLQLATKRYDRATIEKLLTGDYVLVSSSGAVYNRSAFLADIADRSYKYELNEPQNTLVKHYGDDCAIVTGVLHIRLSKGTKVVDVRVRYGDTWVKVGGRWQYAYG